MPFGLPYIRTAAGTGILPLSGRFWTKGSSGRCIASNPDAATIPTAGLRGAPAERRLGGLAFKEAEQNQWRLKSEYGGGILTDWGSHLFDQLVLLSSARVSGVLGKTESRIWSREVEDHFWAELFLDDGTTATLEEFIELYG